MLRPPHITVPTLLATLLHAAPRTNLLRPVVMLADDKNSEAEGGTSKSDLPSALDVFAPSQYGRGSPGPGKLTASDDDQAFNWNQMDAYQGTKVMQAKQKLTKPQRPLAERVGSVLVNISEQGPGTVLLVGFFVFLTFFDVFFNVSRGFICALDGMSLCDAVHVADGVR
jgi:hypothetical protein